MSSETEIRARVIEYAAWKFASNGIKGRTMDELAEQLGMSKRTLYELFRDKKSLVKECLAFFEEMKKSMSRKVFAESSNAFEALLKIYKANLEGMQRVDKKFIEDIKKYFPEINKEREKAKALHLKKSSEIFKKGMDEGFIVKDFDPNNLSLLLAEEMELIFSAQQFNTSKTHFMEAYKTLCLIFFRGIATSKGIEMMEKIMSEK